MYHGSMMIHPDMKHDGTVRGGTHRVMVTWAHRQSDKTTKCPQKQQNKMEDKMVRTNAEDILRQVCSRLVAQNKSLSMEVDE